MIHEESESSQPQSCYVPHHGWRRTITLWCTIRAFEGVKCPACFEGAPDLATAFVLHVSDAVNNEGLGPALTKARRYVQSIDDRFFRENCGPEYCRAVDDLNRARDEASAAYTRTYVNHRSDERVELASGSIANLWRSHCDGMNERFYEDRDQRIHSQSTSLTQPDQSYWVWFRCEQHLECSFEHDYEELYLFDGFVKALKN